MTSIKEMAQAYEPKTTKNIAELQRVRCDMEVEEKTYTDKDNKEFSVLVAEIDGEDYRVPLSVLKDLKILLEDDPEIEYFKVLKSGEGMNTKYTVKPLKL
jgi:hypothetical protein